MLLQAVLVEPVSGWAYTPREAATNTRLLGASMTSLRMTWLSSSVPPTRVARLKVAVSGLASRYTPVPT